MPTVLEEDKWGEPSQAHWDARFYKQLRQRAAFLLCKQQLADCLQPEDLVHEAYLRLRYGSVEQDFNDVDHYLNLATLVMRHSLIDRARASRAVKRFGGLKRTQLTVDIAGLRNDLGGSCWVNDLFEKCGRSNERSATVARMHFIEEMPLHEIAVALSLSTRTVKRDLKTATIQLRQKFGAPTRCAKPLQKGIVN